MIAGLDDFAAHFATALFEAIPESLDSARVADGHLHVELRSSASPAPEAIHVYTTEDEVLVDFGYWGDHFDWPPSGEDFWEDPIAFVRGLMADRILIAERMRGREWLGSAVVAEGCEPFEKPRAPDEVVFVRSWSGRKDRTVRCE